MRYTFHGLSKEKFYKIWYAMHRRCKISPYYKNIYVSKKWHTFLNFRDDMHASYLNHKKKNKSTTLERIDNKKGYSLKNCRWATWQEQFRNQRNNHFLIYKGKRFTISELARKIKIHHTLLRYRIKKWGFEKAVSVPVLNNRTRHTLKHLYK